MLASKQLKFHDFDRFIHDVTGTPIVKEQMKFRSYNHKIYFLKCNRVAIHNPVIKNFKIMIG